MWGDKNKIDWDNVNKNSNYNEILHFIEKMNSLYEKKLITDKNNNNFDEILKRMDNIYNTSYTTYENKEENDTIKEEFVEKKSFFNKITEMKDTASEWITNPSTWYKAITNKKYGVDKPDNIKMLEKFLEPGEKISGEEELEELFDDETICNDVSTMITSLEVIFKHFNEQKMKKKNYIEFIDYEKNSISDILTTFMLIKKNVTELACEFYTLNIV